MKNNKELIVSIVYLIILIIFHIGVYIFTIGSSNSFGSVSVFFGMSIILGVFEITLLVFIFILLIN